MTAAAVKAKGRKGPVASGPNARKRAKSADPRPPVSLSLPTENSAELAIRFLETLKIPEGRLAGQPLKLAEFQRKFVRGALADGVMVAVLSIGRGNAKTALSAGLALGALKGVWDSQPKREILFAARNRDQAKTAFQFLVGFIEGLPEDEQALFTIRRGAKLEVEYSANGGGLARCVAADGKSILGGAPTLALMDERAAWEPEKGDSLENAILSGLGKRDGRALIISTSAPDDTNTFSRWMDEPPIGTYVQEHRPAFGLPADDLPSLLEANPGAVEGFGPSAEWLLAQAQRAIARGGSALSSFRNLNRNERVSSEEKSVLITVDEWLAAEVDPDDLPRREGPCILGVDLGGSRSMSAAALYWPDTGRLEAVGAFPGKPSKQHLRADLKGGRTRRVIVRQPLGAADGMAGGPVDHRAQRGDGGGHVLVCGAQDGAVLFDQRGMAIGRHHGIGQGFSAGRAADHRQNNGRNSGQATFSDHSANLR